MEAWTRIVNFNKASLLTGVSVFVGGVIVAVTYLLLVHYGVTHWDSIGDDYQARFLYEIDRYELFVFLYILILAPAGYFAGIILGSLGQQRKYTNIGSGRGALILNTILFIIQVVFALIFVGMVGALKVLDFIMDALSHLH